MSMIRRRNFATPDEIRRFPHGEVAVIHLEGLTLGRVTLRPGFRWSYDIAPIAQTESCQVRHTAVCVSGRMEVACDDGTEMIIEAGDFVVIQPGHDAWTVGATPCVLYDTGVASYATPPRPAAPGAP